MSEVKVDNDWEIEDAVRILVRAEEIKKDSELMKKVQPKLEKMKQAVLNAAEILYKREEQEK